MWKVSLTSGAKSDLEERMVDIQKRYQPIADSPIWSYEERAMLYQQESKRLLDAVMQKTSLDSSPYQHLG